MIATSKGNHLDPNLEREYPSRNPDPTHEEIRAACQKIQKEWNEREFQKRAGTRPTPWSTPVVSLPVEE